MSIRLPDVPPLTEAGLDFPKNFDKATRYLAAGTLLRRKILSGEIAHGAQLQPELDLCREINLSRTTVRKAIADLVKEGLVERFVGRGTFVNIKRSTAQKHLLAFLSCGHLSSGYAQKPSSAYDFLHQGAELAASEAGYHNLQVIEIGGVVIAELGGIALTSADHCFLL